MKPLLPLLLAAFVFAAPAASASPQPALTPSSSAKPASSTTMPQKTAAPRAGAPKTGTQKSTPPKAAVPAAAPKSRPSTAAALAPITSQTSEAVRIALVLTLLALIPALVLCMTPFVRIIVVLSMIRHAFGMPETPPNQVLVLLSLFLTAFIMMPTFARINDDALQPYLAGSMALPQATAQGSAPLREFMLRQVHDSDIKTIYDIARQPLPDKAADVGLMQLTSAFMLNELRVSFKIGFVIMLPFLLIDIVVSSILLSLGMIMVPPTTLSLPIKVLMFVLIDGWSLILQGVVGSFR